MPTNAEDALTILHKLQVYQVELDLQHEQFELNAQELAAELMCNRVWLKHAPVGLFVVSTDRHIIEGNLIATQFFALNWEICTVV